MYQHRRQICTLNIEWDSSPGASALNCKSLRYASPVYNRLTTFLCKIYIRGLARKRCMDSEFSMWTWWDVRGQDGCIQS